MIRFKNTTLGDHVKDWSYEQLEESFKGKLDYIGLAKQLGIKKTRKKAEPKKVESKKSSSSKSSKED